MKLTPVGLEAESTLVTKLAAGFPARKPAFWHRGFDRLRRASAVAGDAPIAWLLGDPHSPTGAMLALPGLIVDNGTTRIRQINLSSWFVDENARGAALWMLRKVSADRQGVFTDLTPSAGVRRLLPALGFKPVNAGMARSFTATAARHGHGAWRITDADDMLSSMSNRALALALRQHLTLGCLVLALTPCNLPAAGASPLWPIPVVLLPRRRRGVIPVAEVIFMPPSRHLPVDPLHALPTICQHLFRQGFAFLEIEVPLNRPLPIPHRVVNVEQRLARGPYETTGINHLYSELVYFGF